MSGVIYQATAGALLQQMRLNVLSNNLANVNTVGFKAEKPVFRIDSGNVVDAYQTVGVGLSPLAPPMEQIIDYTGGPLKMTGNPLDVAIVGDGFFEISTPNGPQYTRSGSFTINPDGLLSTGDGWPVVGQGGEIEIKGSRVEIGSNGEIAVDGDVVDKLQVVDFPQPYELQKVGNARFIPRHPAVFSRPAEDFTISQGYIEVSNVDAIRTMTELIDTMRAFESYQRIIRNADEAIAKTVNDVGRSV